MKWIVIDTESTTHNEGNPFDQQNKLCLVQYATAEESGYFKIAYDDDPYGKELDRLFNLLCQYDTFIGFNLKHDLHWLRRYGFVLPANARIWDCQLVEFVLDYQRTPFPSLNWACQRHKLGQKIDVVYEQYWSKGIDTPNVPFQLLSEYGVRDAELTRELYYKQVEAVALRGDTFRNLVSLSNADVLCTAEMEWNGLLLDVDACATEDIEAGKELEEIERELRSFFGVGEWLDFTPRKLSSLLFGGTVVEQWKEQVGVFKTGQKIGEPRYTWKERTHEFPALVQPAKGTGLVNGGYSTSEDNLRCVRTRGSKRVDRALNLVIRRAELAKLRGTYYQGLPELLSRMGWAGNYLHGKINHAVTRTGRTSSSEPNMQNLPPAIDRLFRSRFGADGLIAAFDAKGLEWVGIAYLSQDPVAMQEIWNGVDQHEMNRQRWNLPEKRVAKFFVFRLLYGGSAWAFANDPDFFWVSDDESFWQKVMDDFYTKYNVIGETHKAWFKSAVETGRYDGPVGQTFLYTAEDHNWKARRPVILNYPVQSIGHHLVAIARVSFYRRFMKLGLRSKLVNTIHDSIVLDIHKEEWYTIKSLMEEVFADIPKNYKNLFGEEFNLPMKVEAKNLTGEEITI